MEHHLARNRLDAPVPDFLKPVLSERGPVPVDLQVRPVECLQQGVDQLHPLLDGERGGHFEKVPYSPRYRRP